MRTVRTKGELENAILERERSIRVTGDLARRMISKHNRRKKSLLYGGIALTGISLVAIPFTGGLSSAGIMTGITATGLTIGTVTMTTAELLIICGTLLGIGGIIVGAKVTFYGDHVIIEPHYKA